MADDLMTPEEALNRALAAKAVRRQQLARLPYEEKIAIALRLREMALSMKANQAVHEAVAAKPRPKA